MPVNRGRCNFDVMRYDICRDSTVAREAFRKGLFDVHFGTDIGHWRTSFDGADSRQLAGPATSLEAT